MSPKGIKGSKAPHGTVARYMGHGCRCDLCREAVKLYYRNLRGSTPLDEYRASVRAPHGTQSAYHRGCRCDECRVAASAGRRERRARAAQ